MREGKRQVEDKDVYRLSTKDPENYPLPHPLLLSTHALLWHMTTAAGLDPVVPKVLRSTRGKRRLDDTNNQRSAKRRAKYPVSPPHTPLSPPKTPVSRVRNARNTPGTKKAYPQDLSSLLEDDSNWAAGRGTGDGNKDKDVKPVVSAAIKGVTQKSLFSTTRKLGSRRDAPIVIDTDDEDETPPPTPIRVRTRTSPRTRTRTLINFNINSDDENKSDDEAGSEYFPE